MSRYPTAKAGQWIQPKRVGYLMACCDCGLVHRMEFRIVSDSGGYRQRVQLRAWRAMGETKAHRKRQGITVRTGGRHG